jgi:CRISPR type I-E-associated protein CasB/Cse2
LARTVVELDPGERAALRRMQPDAPSPAAMGLAIRLLIQSGAADPELRPARLRRWTLLLQGLALLAGTAETASPHRRGETLGLRLRTLLANDEAEQVKEADLRLLTLLEARGEAFDTLLIRMIRRLAASGVTTIDAVGLWRLVVEPDDEDRQRLTVARDFYRGRPQAGQSAA